MSNRAKAGVLGVLAGVSAGIRAVEALRILAGVGQTAAGKRLVHDALASDGQIVQSRREPAGG